MERVLRSASVSEMPSPGTRAAKELGTSCYRGAREALLPMKQYSCWNRLGFVWMGIAMLEQPLGKEGKRGQQRRERGYRKHWIRTTNVRLRGEDRTTKVKHEQSWGTSAPCQHRPQILMVSLQQPKERFSDQLATCCLHESTLGGWRDSSALTALAEDLGSIPSSHVMAHNHL